MSGFERWAFLFFVEAGRGLMRHKLRSALSVLGIMIGIAAVVWVVAIGRAGSARAEAQLEALGDNLVWIEAGSRNVNGVRSGTHGTNSLTSDDAEAIAREVPLVKQVAPNVDGSIQIIAGNRNWNTRYRGVSPEYLDIKRWSLSAGAPFTAEHCRDVASVCLIGETVKKRLFGSASAVGEIVRVQGTLFEVVGVLAPKGQSSMGQDQDDTVFIPWTTAQKKLKGKGYEWLDDILCSAVSRDAVNPAIDQVSALLRQRHRIGPGEDDDFNIRRPDEVVKAQMEASNALALLLISVAMVSLLVGGIGIMNVMLASVAQRTSEIGLRLAVGATESDVRTQFLGEAVLLSLFGGLLGVLLSGLGSFALASALKWPIEIPPQALVLAIAFSAVVGVFFGFYPARRAARLDPIAAIRHE